jgi:predicted methyltransferase
LEFAAMEELDRQCRMCAGTGRVKTGDADVDGLEQEIAKLNWDIASLTETYGLDLRHRTTIPGEAEARENVGTLQVELSQKLKQLAATRLAAGSHETVCPECHGRGLVLTEAGEKIFNFIYRWVHPTR